MSSQESIEARVPCQEEQVMDAVLNIAKSISRSGEGSLIIIANRNAIEGLYETHYPQVTSTSLVTEQGMNVLVEKLATIDGAVIVTPGGSLVAYGARILKSTTLPGFGTRHAAAAGVTESLPNATAVLISEESSLIKIFQKGDLVIEMDSAELNPDALEKVIAFLTRNDMALVVVGGMSFAVLSIPLTSILLICGAYFVVRLVFGVVSWILIGSSEKEKA